MTDPTAPEVRAERGSACSCGWSGCLGNLPRAVQPSESAPLPTVEPASARERLEEVLDTLFTSHSDPCEHLPGMLLHDGSPYFRHECRDCVRAALEPESGADR